MDIKNFKSGSYRRQYQYRSFTPEPINHPWIISDASLQHLLSETDRKLGELNAFSQLIPDVDFFIKMHIAKEATQSSRIEGTQTGMKEVLKKESDLRPEEKDDWVEVHNYIKAMSYGITELHKLPLSNRLLKQTHQKLLQGVRGRNKMPGEFRTSQNWIGGATLNDAAFIPPSHTEVPELMSDLEKFLNNTEIQVPHLIKIGIAHYQFETIHPFLDGNGRLGRLLITLYLVHFGILERPTLYLSDFFERNREHYYDNLTRARSKNDLIQWLLFFLIGVRETTINSIETFHHILALKEECEEKKIPKLGKKTEAAKILIQHLFSKPIVHASDVAAMLKINVSTANRFINDFIKLGILKEQTGFKRNRIFIFHKYLDLFIKQKKTNSALKTKTRTTN
ncbi:Fic family protein [bacterium]|nr:Fic family protein [bacterium]